MPKIFFQFVFNNKINLLYIIPILFVLLFLLFTDARTSVDTLRFIEWSNEMSLNPLNAVNYLYLERSITGVLFFFSVIYFKISLIFSENWKILFISMNFLAFLLTVYLIKNKLSSDIKFCYFIPSLAIVNYDYLNWSNYLLTDFLFCYLCFIFLVYLSIGKNNIGITLLLLVLIMFTRPPGIVILLIAIQYFFLANSANDKSVLFRRILILLTFYFVLIFFVSYLIINNIFFNEMNDPSMKSSFQYYRNYYMQGVIINDRPHTYLEKPENIIDIIKIIIVRFYSYFIFYDKLYSFNHNFLNILIYTPIYILMILTLIKFRFYKLKQQKIILIMFVSIISFSFFHSILLIDFDWRYRLPCILPMCVLAVLGLEQIRKIEKVSIR